MAVANTQERLMRRLVKVLRDFHQEESLAAFEPLVHISQNGRTGPFEIELQSEDLNIKVEVVANAG